MPWEVVSAITKLDTVATRPVHTSTIETIETVSKPSTSLDKSDLEFLKHADHDTNIDVNIQLYSRLKLMQADGTDLELTDTTCVAKIY